MYADDLVRCGESEEELRAVLGWFVEVCRRRGLKVSAGKSKVIVLNGEEGLECEVHVDGTRLEYVSEFKYMGCVLDESGTNWAECSRKVAGVIRSLEIARLLEPCMKHCLYLFLRMTVKQFYGRRRKDLGLGLYRWTTSMGLLGIRRMDRVPNSWIREFCGVKNEVDEKIDEGVLR